MNIKEIAEQVSKRIYVEDGLLLSKFISEKFAEALIAEIAKQNKPCAFLHEWIEYHPFGDTFAGKPCTTITNDEKPFDSSDTVSPFFTYQPTAEQIANETAEACAEMLESQHTWITKEAASALVRNGEWRKFVKEV